jgi:hypothetical protein
MYHDMWITAKKAKTQKAIFCGWWRNQLYSVDPQSDIYRTYWGWQTKCRRKGMGLGKFVRFTTTRSIAAKWRGGDGSSTKALKTNP